MTPSGKSSRPVRCGLAAVAVLQIALAAADARGEDRDAIWANVARAGSARIIVEYRDPGPRRPGASRTTRRGRTARARSELLAGLSGTRYAIRRSFERLPAVALEVGASALDRLEHSPHVAAIYEDRAHAPAVRDAAISVQALSTWAAGVRGSGQVVAVLDTGVDAFHPSLRDAVVHEACFSQSGDCPNGSSADEGPGAAQPCTFADRACAHGTHVAGIVAGRSAEHSGVAPAAGVLAIQVFSRSYDCRDGESAPCPRTFTSDYIRALEYVYRLREHYPIAAANLSFAGGSYDSVVACDEANPLAKNAIDDLRAAGIATIVAAGNSGSPSSTGTPACISSAISVGSVDADKTISSFSNHPWFVDFVAPGRSLQSSVPGGGFAPKSGTSMAAPVVAGAWALLRERDPTAPVDLVHAALTMTADHIENPESASFLPFIDVRAAHDYLTGSCPCPETTESFCDYPQDACRMTAPGGYCDPNGDGNFADADWARGWNEFQSVCRTPPKPSRSAGAAWLRNRNAPGSRGTRRVAAAMRAEVNP